MGTRHAELRRSAQQLEALWKADNGQTNFWAIEHYRTAYDDGMGDVWVRSFQQPWVQMRIALAEAWAGRPAEASRDAQLAMAEATARDSFDAVNLRGYLGEIYVSLGQREEAFACLRQMMREPFSLSPNEIRIDPLWSRLKADPRFEEILKSTKPL